MPRLQALGPEDVAVPAIVVYELRYGLERLPAEAARPRLMALEALLKPMQILTFDNGCAEVAASIRAALEHRGTPIGPHDLLIAATALRHGATLVTRNAREFSKISGLNIANWHDD